MNKEEFLRKLEGLLQDISEEERADAMDFYRSYFEDAGEGKEASIIEELESPEKVAEIIKKDLGIENHSKDSETGSSNAGNMNNDGSGTSQNRAGSVYGNANYGYTNPDANRDSEYYKNVNNTINNLEQQNKKSNTAAIVLGVIVAVLTSPIWLTILAVVAALALSVIAVLIAIAACVLAVMVACVVAGFAVFGVGVGLLFSGSIAYGFALIGIGLLILAVGLLTVVASVWIFGWFLPWAFKGIWHLIKMPFDKRKEKKAA